MQANPFMQSEKQIHVMHSLSRCPFNKLSITETMSSLLSCFRDTTDIYWY